VNKQVYPMTKIVSVTLYAKMV